MQISLSLNVLLLVATIVLVAGVVNGVAGFGFAIVGTMALASLIAPATAVVFMILPIFAANLTLVRELSVADLRSCGSRFAPLILSALVGTVVGMAILESLPAAPLRVGLGVLTLGFVLTAQNLVALPGLDRAKSGCFVESTPAMVGLGGISGVVFGGTNVGVQLIAYVRSCDLSHGLFVGVVALVFLGLNGVRVGAAGALGLYPDLATVGLSAAAAVPAVVGVTVGQRVRGRVSTQARRRGVFLLLTLIGIRLVLGGLGIA
ncbi:sulfite exporter TauE/SafE family protein [Salinibaculum salinum]|uniref:sulfite exporter TauE/SafE family protein n=1 Tax=Salinibaculum salinum TaxID=3131996 RepID=UPI0030EF2710